MSVSNDDAQIDATQTQEISSEDERERKKIEIDDIGLRTAKSIKKARLMADDNQLEEAKGIIVNAQSTLHEMDFVELETLKLDLQRLLMLIKTQETYEKQGRAFALSLETSHDSYDLAERGAVAHFKHSKFGNEGPSSGTGKTKVKIITKREAPLKEREFNVTLELTSNETPGLDLVMVLDISGSMLGEKLEKMKAAMQLVIRKLSRIDRLSVVTFSSNSKMLCPLRPMTKNSKEIIEKQVNVLAADGGTNISAGLEMGLQVLKDCCTSRRWVAIMLLCDGDQNPGNQDAAEVEVGNVPVYTFGLGSYYNPKVLKAIANKNKGGKFTDVRNVDKLTEEFSHCLDGLLGLIVKELKVTIKPKESTKIKKVSAKNYPQYREDIDSVIVPLGDLYDKDTRKVIVDLHLPDVSSTTYADILEISYMYSFGGEPIHTNPIIVTITRRNSAPMINESRDVTDKQLNVANKMIIEAQNLLEKGVDESLTSEVQQLKRLMNSQKLYNEKESEEVTIDDIHLLDAESGETIRTLENYSTASPLGQASTVDINNDVNTKPIEFLLDRTTVRKRIGKSLSRSNNYVDWSVKVNKVLEELNLRKVIEEPPTATTESIDNVDMGTAIQKLRQVRKNWMALILINQACGFPMNLQIIDLDSAKAAWYTLATSCNQGGSDDERYFLSAVERGDWKTGECLLDSNPELATARIPYSQNTVLHLASLAGEVNIVKKLVALMEPQDLEIKDKDGYTALANVSINGDKRIAQCMVQKNRRLVSIASTGTKLLPVVIAMMHGKKEMASYLYYVTPPNDLANKDNINGATLLTYSIRMQLYDISFDLIHKYSHLTVALDHNGQSALYQLACTPSAFFGSSKLKFWQKWMYNCVPVPDIDSDPNGTRLSVSDDDISQSNWWNAGYRGLWQQIASPLLALLGIKRIYEMKLVHHQSPRLLDLICEQIEDDLDNDEINGIMINALHEAATKGVVEFIVRVLKKFPEYGWLCDKEGSNIFMKAVQFRQADIFCLIHEFPSQDKMVVLVDNCGENILHKLQYSSVDKISIIQGGLVKMQKEIKWHEKIKSMMPPDSLKKLNNKGKTAQELIDGSHKRLIINAEKEMKDTANSCIVVGILVVTIMFAAAFTVPGGNNQDTGLPLFLKKKLFKIFIISDAVSLCFSTVSVIMFLGILTSRYAENDFLEPLPTKLIIGISSLFISLTAMMVAFTATLFIMLRREFWISIPITVVLTSLPVILFALLFFPLLSECVRSTYGPSIFNRKSKLSLIG